MNRYRAPRAKRPAKIHASGDRPEEAASAAGEREKPVKLSIILATVA